MDAEVPAGAEGLGTVEAGDDVVVVEDEGTEDEGTEDEGTEDEGTEDEGTEDEGTEDDEGRVEVGVLPEAKVVVVTGGVVVVAPTSASVVVVPACVVMAAVAPPGAVAADAGPTARALTGAESPATRPMTATDLVFRVVRSNLRAVVGRSGRARMSNPPHVVRWNRFFQRFWSSALRARTHS